MSSIELDNLIEQVKQLTPADRRRLLAAVSSPQTPVAQTPEDALDQLLLRDGLIERIPPPVQDPQSYNDWRPVPIKGKPLSETVIEERR